jgi:hypothetical protein
VTTTVPAHERTEECYLLERERWASSGLLWLTGEPGAPPRWTRAGLFEGLDRARDHVVREATSVGRTVDLDVGRLLTGRAALMGLTRRGRVSAGGACRLLPAADGWVAVSLARPEDVDLVAAITGVPITEERATTGRDGDRAWAVLARYACDRPGYEVMERAQLLGVPATVVAAGPTERSSVAESRGPVVVHTGRPARDRRGGPFTVVDLSSLWAGPLCAKVLSDVGGRVIKVESHNRPDGGRIGCPPFFDWLHADHQSVVLDFGSQGDRSLLGALIARADVVIEASRPRALMALGVDAEAIVDRTPGMTWLSITGYGRHGDDADRVAFGDDAAAAAGMVAHSADGSPVFCGDAVADPVTGLVAACAVLDSRSRGGGELISVTMVDAVRSVMRPLPPGRTPVLDGAGADRWTVDIGGSSVTVDPPSPVSATRPAPARGAHTRSVVAELEAASAPS